MAVQRVTANSLNRRPMMPPMNSTGMNTAPSETVMEMMVNPISRDPRKRGLERRLALLHVPDNVFQHHDGVVHHEPDAQDQRHHGDVVQAVVQQVHHGERAQDRERQRHAGDQRGRGIAQEQENHRDHQAQRDRHGELDVVGTPARILVERSPRTFSVTEGGRWACSVGSTRLMSSVILMVLLPACRMMPRLTARSAPCRAC